MLLEGTDRQRKLRLKDWIGPLAWFSEKFAINTSFMKLLYMVFLKHTRRCGPLRRPSSSSCKGLRPSTEAVFCPSGKKRAFYICFGPNFGHFWWSVVTSVTFSSNHSNLKKLKKKNSFYAILAQILVIWWSVITLVTLNSTLTYSSKKNMQKCKKKSNKG